MHIVPEAGVAASELRLVKGSHRQGARHRPGERVSGVGSCALMGQKNRSRHLPASERWLAGFPRTDKDAHDAGAQGGRRGVMVTGLLAVLIVGTLAGSVEADRGVGRYRTPDYPRYSRDYYDGYGGGYGAYGGCGGYRGYAGCGGYDGCRGYGPCGGYGGYGAYGWSGR